MFTKMRRFWKVRAMPRRAALATLSLVASTPSRTTLPAAGFCTQVMTLNSVVFPAPFGPMTAAISPSRTLRETWSTATSPPKFTLTPSTFSSSRLLGRLGCRDSRLLPGHVKLGLRRGLAQRQATDGPELGSRRMRSWVTRLPCNRPKRPAGRNSRSRMSTME